VMWPGRFGREGVQLLDQISVGRNRVPRMNDGSGATVRTADIYKTNNSKFEKKQI